MDTQQTNRDTTADGTEPRSIAKSLLGHPVFPIDAFSFGRRWGRRMKLLFPDHLLHVLRGVRAGIKEIRERSGGAGHES